MANRTQVLLSRSIVKLPIPGQTRRNWYMTHVAQGAQLLERFAPSPRSRKV